MVWSEAQSRNSWRWWIGYAVTVALGMWLHMTMLFVVVDSRSDHRRCCYGIVISPGYGSLLLAFTLSGAFTLQVFALTLPEFMRSARGEISMPSEWTQPLWAVAELLKGLRIGFSSGQWSLRRISARDRMAKSVPSPALAGHR